jgi:hypothetical protein
MELHKLLSNRVWQVPSQVPYLSCQMGRAEMQTLEMVATLEPEGWPRQSPSDPDRLATATLEPQALKTQTVVIKVPPRRYLSGRKPLVATSPLVVRLKVSLVPKEQRRVAAIAHARPGRSHR